MFLGGRNSIMTTLVFGQGDIGVRARPCHSKTLLSVIQGSLDRLRQWSQMVFWKPIAYDAATSRMTMEIHTWI